MSEFRYNGKHRCGQRISLVSPVRKGGLSVTCPNCQQRAWLKRVQGEFNPDHACDERCLNAHGNKCVCACGGANHGKNHGIAQVVAVDRREREEREFNEGFKPVRVAQFVGEVGKHITGEVTLRKRRLLQPSTVLFDFYTNDGDRITWFCPDYAIPEWGQEEGWKGTIRARVKAHEDHPQYGKQTIVTYVEEM